MIKRIMIIVSIVGGMNTAIADKLMWPASTVGETSSANHKINSCPELLSTQAQPSAQGVASLINQVPPSRSLVVDTPETPPGTSSVGTPETPPGTSLFGTPETLPSLSITWDLAKKWRAEIEQAIKDGADVRSVSIISESWLEIQARTKIISLNTRVPVDLRVLAQSFGQKLSQTSNLTYKKYISLAYEFALIADYALRSKEKLPPGSLKKAIDQDLKTGLQNLKVKLLDLKVGWPLPIFKQLSAPDTNKLWFAGLLPLGISDKIEHVDRDALTPLEFLVHDIEHALKRIRELYKKCSALINISGNTANGLSERVKSARLRECVTNQLVEAAWFYDRLQLGIQANPEIQERVVRLAEALIFQADHERYENPTSGYGLIGSSISFRNNLFGDRILKPGQIESSHIYRAASSIFSNGAIGLLQPIDPEFFNSFDIETLTNSYQLILSIP